MNVQRSLTTNHQPRTSRSAGVEWTNYWRLRPWLTADMERLLLARGVHRYRSGWREKFLEAESGGLTVEPRQRIFGRPALACAYHSEG